MTRALPIVTLWNREHSEADPLTMSTLWVLQRLYRLDTSSPGFLSHLYFLIRHDEKEQYFANLQGSELARLVDFLDKVHATPYTFHHFTKQTPQALGAIPTTDDVARECLNKLQAICGHHATLPSAYVVSDQISGVGDGPVALGAIADVWEGTHRGKRVTIKPLKVPLSDDRTFRKVRVLYNMSLSRLLGIENL